MKRDKVELHLHLDGSLNIMWAYKKALERNVIDKETTFEEFYNILFSRNTVHSAESIKKFDLVCDLLQYREDLYDATYDLCRRLYDLGVIYAEIRFASQQHCKKGLSQLEALQAVCEGAAAAMADYDIQIGIINCLMHKGDSAKFNEKENLETIEVTKQLLGKGAVALDLAGFENYCDFKEYKPLFDLASSYEIPYTIHAGEMGIAEHINDALDFGAYRIGHGVNCVKDEAILKRVIDTQIPLEVCLSSNCKPENNFAAHPIRFLMEKGAKVTVNTDNMIFAKSDIVNEHNQLKMLGVSDEQLRQCTINAIESAFCDPEVKYYLLDKLN